MAAAVVATKVRRNRAAHSEQSAAEKNTIQIEIDSLGRITRTDGGGDASVDADKAAQRPKNDTHTRIFNLREQQQMLQQQLQVRSEYSPKRQMDFVQSPRFSPAVPRGFGLGQSKALESRVASCLKHFGIWAYFYPVPNKHWAKTLREKISDNPPNVATIGFGTSVKNLGTPKKFNRTYF